MGVISSKSIDFKKNLCIIFDTFPIVDYKNGSESNLLEKNIYYKNYIKKNIIRAFRRISDIKIVIDNNQLIVQFRITPKPNIIYYNIYAEIEFVIKKEKKSINNIDLSNKVLLMSNINNYYIYNDDEKITFELLKKTIHDVFKKDILTIKKIKIDKDKFLDLDNDFIQNIQIYQRH
jgi:hypothetical protein